MARITSPVPGFTGDGPQGLRFEDGQATTDNEALIAYFRRKGYGVDGDPVLPADPDPADPREVSEVVVGTRLRDAAVDPREGDFLPPTNAGEANPHGPQVVSPGIHGERPGPVAPGLVSDDPKLQEEKEARAAVAAIAGDLMEDRDASREAEILAGSPTLDQPPTAPAGNASKDEWAAYAVEMGANPEGLKDLTRDQIRSEYGPKK